MEYAIEVHKISKNYGLFSAVSDVTFKIPKGSICGFVGKNGAGKTTVFRILTDLQKADSGEYILFGEKIATGSIKRDTIGALVESPALYLAMTAEENIRQLYRVRGIPSFDGVHALLEMVGLDDVKKKKVKDYSLGMKQKLGLAMVLEGNPDLLILDEPMNGLDPQSIIAFRNLILKLNREKGVTFLISSHNLEELTKIATDYVFIDHGRIVRQMTARDLEAESKKAVSITVSDQKVAEKALKEKHIEYCVAQSAKLDVFTEMTVTELVLVLKERGCDVLRCHEQDENLEAFFIQLVGEAT